MRDFVHAPKRQIHDAALVDLTAGFDRRIHSHRDMATGH
jgi:hypothetical protein